MTLYEIFRIILLKNFLHHHIFVRICICASHWCSYVDMGRRPSMSSNERARALGMLQLGLSTRRVAAIFGVAYSTMSRLMIRFNATNSVNDRRWSGRPKATTHRQDKLIRTLTLRNRTITAQALQGQLRTAAGVTVSDQTNPNRLHAAGLRARRPVVRFPLKQRHRIHHLEWCRRHLQWNGLQWARVAFSDESRFNRYFNDGRMRVTDVVVNDIPTSTSKNMTVTEEGQ